MATTDAPRDGSFIPTALFEIDGSSTREVMPGQIDEATGRILVDSAAGGGTVTSVSVVSANGFAGSVATATTTPAITLSTTITGILSGNGTAISAATTTGSGSVVLATSPALVTPDLGTPSAVVLTNATGTAASLNIGGNAGTVTVANEATDTTCFIAFFTAASGSLAGKTNTNLTFNSNTGVLTSASSVLTTTDINGGTVDGTVIGGSSAAAGTFTTITANTGIEVQNTDTTITRSAGGVIAVEGVVIPSISSTNTLTNKRVTRRLTTTNAPGATPTTNTDNVDVMNFTGLATAITSMTTNLSGTPVDGDLLEIRFTDDGTPRAITWGASFVATTFALPTTTVASTMLRTFWEWNGSAWASMGQA